MQDNTATITRASRALYVACWFGLLGIPLLIGSVWLFGSEALLLSGEAKHLFIPHGVSFEQGRLDGGLRFTGLLISLIPGGVMMFGLWQLAQLFSRFAALEFYTSQTSRHIRRFAASVAGAGILMPVSGVLLSLATSIGNAPGKRVISLTAGDSELTAIFLGCVMYVIAWVMERGRQLLDEYEGIV